MELNHITNPQSGQSDSRRINADASWLNQSGGGDKLAAVDGN